MLGLRCCTQAFSSCGKRGLLFVASCRLLIVVASLVVEHGLWVHGLSSCGLRALEDRHSSCGARASLLHSMWDLSGPGIEPVSPALAGRFLTTEPPGKSYTFFSSVHGTFSRKDHMLVCKTSLNKFRQDRKYIKHFSDHSGMKLEVNY